MFLNGVQLRKFSNIFHPETCTKTKQFVVIFNNVCFVTINNYNGGKFRGNKDAL